MTPIQCYTRGLWALSCRSETLSNDSTIVLVFILPLHWEPAEPDLHLDIISKCVSNPLGSVRHGLGIQLQDERVIFFYDPSVASFPNPSESDFQGLSATFHTQQRLPEYSVQKGRYTINTQWQLLNTIPALVEKVNCLLNAWLRHSPDKASCQAGRHGKFNLLSLQTAWFHFKE